MFTLVALILIWVPAVTHVDRLPFVIGLGVPAGVTAGCFAWMMMRLPREARLLVRRTLRARRVSAALALAVGGVAAAFGLVALAPAPDLAQWLPVAAIITVGARLSAFAALRARPQVVTYRGLSSAAVQRTARTDRMDSTEALLASP